jgi:hypothetical protein
MPVSYRIDNERRLILTSAEGCVTFAEVQTHQDQLLSDPAYDPSFDQLIDGTAATEFALSADEARQVAKRQLVSKQSRRALVATEAAIFGMGRLMAAYQEIYGLSNVEVFYKLEEALEWLNIKPELP